MILQISGYNGLHLSDTSSAIASFSGTSADDTTFVVPSLTSGQTYGFAVVVKDKAGNYSPLSDEIYATTK